METRSKKRKRQRLISIASNVSSRQRPDLPAIFDSLNDDTLTTVLEFVGDKSYRSFGGINKHCKEIYLSSGMTKKTFLFGYAPLSVIQDRYNIIYTVEALVKGVLFYNRKDAFEWALQERNIYLLRQICFVAAGEGRIDILEDLWNNIEGEVFEHVDLSAGVDEYAARDGKLSVLKWLHTKCFSFSKDLCAEEAAKHGHVHILQWLQEEKDLELKDYLYFHAAKSGGNLHVLKWIREQGCPWSKWTCRNAAEVGNLDILQWIHNEGCPWPEDNYLRVHEHRVKPEVVEWLRMNGYGDRIVG